MAILFLFIFFLSNIILIKSIDIFFVSKILEERFHNNTIQRSNQKYNLNIQIIENRTITNNILINTSYISKDYSFEFLYTGKFFYLNETNINLLSNDDKFTNDWIFLMDSYKAFNDYSTKNKSLIKFLTRAIIVPKDSFPTIAIISRYCLFDLSIYLIEVEQDTFNKIKAYSDNMNNDYYAKINSKKCDFFPYKELYQIIFFLFLVFFTLLLIYRIMLKIYANSFSGRQLRLFKKINDNTYYKVIILLLLFIELNSIFNYESFIIEYSTFISIITTFFMIINKVYFWSFIFDIYHGEGVFLKDDKLKFIQNLLSSLIMIFYIFFHVFISPITIPNFFYFSNLFIIIPIFFFVSFLVFKNIIFIFRAILKIKKFSRFNKKYGRGIRLKLYITFIQYIIFLIFTLLFLGVNKYFFIKKGSYFRLEKDILFQWLDSFLIFCLGIIYIPIKLPEGFELNIVFMKDALKNTMKLSAEDNCASNLPKEILMDENENKKFVKNNNKKYFTILNPKLFLHKEKDNKKVNLIGPNIKIGKLNVS